jgi:hypothetical protein
MEQLPGQYAPALPKNDRHQIQAPLGQADLGDLLAPALIGADNRHRAQQIRIDLTVGRARARREVNGLQSREPQRALDTLMVDLQAESSLMGGHLRDGGPCRGCKLCFPPPGVGIFTHRPNWDAYCAW